MQQWILTSDCATPSRTFKQDLAATMASIDAATRHTLCLKRTLTGREETLRKNDSESTTDLCVPSTIFEVQKPTFQKPMKSLILHSYKRNKEIKQSLLVKFNYFKMTNIRIHLKANVALLAIVLNVFVIVVNCDNIEDFLEVFTALVVIVFPFST